MNPFSWAFKSNSEIAESEIPALFPLGLQSTDFIKADILQTYVKILVDVAERTHGLKEEHEPLLWDSALCTKTNEGLISLLALAMVEQSALFLVYSPSTKVIRRADQKEEAAIRADYTKQGESKVGIYVSFANYRRTELLRIYSAFEYCVLGSLNKTLNVAKSIQFKINDLRASVSLNDSGVAKEQAKSIANAMRNGNDVMLDAKDSVATATPDTSPTEKAIAFLDSKRAFILGLPLSYIMGEQTGGIGSTGEGDMRAVERGLRQYFVSIIRPVFETLFGVQVEFKTQDFRQITSALEVLKTFDLTSESNLSSESKQNIVARVFDLDPDSEKKLIEADKVAAEKAKAANPPPVIPSVDPNAKPGPGVQPPAKPDQTQGGKA